MADRNVTKPLVVTDENLVKLGIAEHVFAPLKEADIDYVVYDKVPPDSSLTVVNEVAELIGPRVVMDGLLLVADLPSILPKELQQQFQ